MLVVSSKKSGEHGTKASLNNFNGKDKTISWSDDSDATAFSMCSLIYEDQFYFLG